MSEGLQGCYTLCGSRNKLSEAPQGWNTLSGSQTGISECLHGCYTLCETITDFPKLYKAATRFAKGKTTLRSSTSVLHALRKSNRNFRRWARLPRLRCSIQSGLILPSASVRGGGIFLGRPRASKCVMYRWHGMQRLTVSPSHSRSRSPSTGTRWWTCSAKVVRPMSRQRTQSGCWRRSARERFRQASDL